VLRVARVSCTLPGALGQVKVGERISFDDGLISGRVRAIDGGELSVRIEQTPPGGAHLKADKGINFPDKRHRASGDHRRGCEEPRVRRQACRPGRAVVRSITNET